MRLLAPLAAFASLGAQDVDVSVAPVVGYYRPLGHFVPASVYVTSLPERPEQLNAALWGATAQFAFPHRVGAVAQFLVTDSRVPEVSTPEGPRGPTNARVTLATVQGQLDVSSAPRAYRLWLNGGPAVVHHGGQAYAPYGSPSAFAGAVGATLAIPLIAHLQFTANASAFVYRIDIPMPPPLRRNPGSLERGTQVDAVFHVGLTLSSF